MICPISNLTPLCSYSHSAIARSHGAKDNTYAVSIISLNPTNLAFNGCMLKLDQLMFSRPTADTLMRYKASALPAPFMVREVHCFQAGPPVKGWQTVKGEHTDITDIIALEFIALIHTIK